MRICLVVQFRRPAGQGGTMIVDCVGRHLHPAVRTSCLAALCAVLLSSCSGLPLREYQRPELAVKSSWSRQTPAAVSASDAIRQHWWEEFRDPHLNALVDKAIAANFDLRILAARIGVAEGQIAGAGAGGLPP